MTKTPDFLETAKSHLDALGSELMELENKISEVGEKADQWSGAQAAKLKQDWQKRTSRDGVDCRAYRYGG